MPISPWQSVCLVLLGAILAVWMDEGPNPQQVLVETPPPCRPANLSNNMIATKPLVQEKVVDEIEQAMAAKAQEKWNHLVATERGKPLNYLRDPRAFIERFQDCAVDPHCHVMYHHVSKTGGTTLEQALFPVFGQDVMHTCCHQRLRQQFIENPDDFCSLKFSSYQMFDDEFLEVVHICQERDPQRRSLLLTTFREPTRTLLSYIHQMCNKLLHKRTERLQEACQACVYENSTDVWQIMAFIIERQIEGCLRVSRSLMMDDQKRNGTDEFYIHHNETIATVVVHTPHEHSVQNFTIDKSRLQVLTLEINDVDSFLWHWQPEVIFGVANPEQAGECNFRLTTELIQRLRPALAIYRLLLAGL